jgi:hypothetical protein
LIKTHECFPITARRICAKPRAEQPQSSFNFIVFAIFRFESVNYSRSAGAANHSFEIFSAALCAHALGALSRADAK